MKLTGKIPLNKKAKISLKHPPKKVAKKKKRRSQMKWL